MIGIVGEWNFGNTVVLARLDDDDNDDDIYTYIDVCICIHGKAKDFPTQKSFNFCTKIGSRSCIFFFICTFVFMWRYPLGPHYINLLRTISLRYGRWSTSGTDRGNAHSFTATSNTIEGVGGRENKRTKQKESYATLCIPDSIYRLTLAWVTSENSTKQLEYRLILTRSSSLSLDPISCWLASLLQCPESTALVRRPSPTACELLCPTNSLLASPSTSGHGEISSPKPFVWFRAKTDKGIVYLAGHLHSVTFIGQLVPFFFSNATLFWISLRCQTRIFECLPNFEWSKLSII